MGEGERVLQHWLPINAKDRLTDRDNGGPCLSNVLYTRKAVPGVHVIKQKVPGQGHLWQSNRKYFNQLQI